MLKDPLFCLEEDKTDKQTHHICVESNTTCMKVKKEETWNLKRTINHLEQYINLSYTYFHLSP